MNDAPVKPSAERYGDCVDNCRGLDTKLGRGVDDGPVKAPEVHGGK
jgi:hypothetical protein